MGPQVSQDSALRNAPEQHSKKTFFPHTKPTPNPQKSSKSPPRPTRRTSAALHPEDRRAQSALVLPAKLERRVGALAARHPLAALERS